MICRHIFKIGSPLAPVAATTILFLLILFHPVSRIYVHELRTFEPVFLIIWNGTVKDCLACNSMITDASRTARIIRWIQRVASDSRNCDDICISLESCVHCPEYVAHIKAVYIFIYQECFSSLNAENARSAACLCLPSSLAVNFLNCRTAIYFPPPADAQYTF